MKIFTFKFIDWTKKGNKFDYKLIRSRNIIEAEKYFKKKYPRINIEDIYEK